jgi:D-alanyl-D-alanine carboxypeptidase
MKCPLMCIGRSSVAVAVGIVLLTSACGSSARHGSDTSSPSAARSAYALGDFPGPPTKQLADSTAHALQAVLDTAAKGDLPGVTATVLAADRGTWSGAAGTADGVHPVDVRSQFAIASITKTVVAAEIMWLSEQGALQLSDPVSAHLPSDFHFDANGVTIHDLLAMESGIPDPVLSESAPVVLADLRHNWQAEEILASVPRQRSKPGDHFVYEDANYMLLGLVVQQTTGMSVAAALRAHILADPDLATLVYQPEERPQGPLALPFLRRSVRPDIVNLGGGYLPSESEASNGNGSGCMASDSVALARWGYLLFGGRLLSKSSLEAMTDFGTGAAYDGYGLGVFDQTNLANGFATVAVGNGAWDDGGYSAALTILPRKGVVISVLTNTAGDPRTLVFPVVQQLAGALEG